jgi:hypothetical protein
MQRRLVKCKIDDNVTVAESKCVEEDKPTHRQECTNVKCVGKWKVGAWSEVSLKKCLKNFFVLVVLCKVSKKE